MKKELFEKTFGGGGYFFSFESFGVSFTICTESAEILDFMEKNIRKILPNEFRETRQSRSEKNFYVKIGKDEAYQFYEVLDESCQMIFESVSVEIFLALLDTKLRVIVAEFAREKVFIHAGAVSYRGFGIIIPGKSFQGKTTLVASLIERGALYYSDEYAVLDERGRLHPFHKKLAMRGIIDDFTQKEMGFEEFGAEAGTEPVPIGLILLTEYSRKTDNSAWLNPEIISGGMGILEILPHTIPIRNNPGFTLQVLYKIVSCAIIAKCRRGEASVFAELLLNYFDEKII